MNWADLALHTRAHLVLCSGALALASALAVPLGVRIAHHDGARPFVLGVGNLVRVVPSLAVLTLALPYLGIGVRPALLALTLLAIPPILINTDVAFRSIAPGVLDAARGVGMTDAQIVRRVEWPLALPIVFAGVRTAAVEVISSATLAAFIGGGGLGEYIINGLALNDIHLLLTGAISVGALALLADVILGTFQRRLAAGAQ